MPDPIQRLDSILRDVLRDGPLAKGLSEQEALIAWPEIVGAEIARHSHAVGLTDGVLLVQVEGSVWAQELALLKPRIRQALEARLGTGKVKDIRFHSGSLDRR